MVQVAIPYTYGNTICVYVLYTYGMKYVYGTQQHQSSPTVQLGESCDRNLMVSIPDPIFSNPI